MILQKVENTRHAIGIFKLISQIQSLLNITTETCFNLILSDQKGIKSPSEWLCGKIKYYRSSPQQRYKDIGCYNQHKNKSWVKVIFFTSTFSVLFISP